MINIWGIVVDPGGVCIEGATVEVVDGPVLVGQTATQRLPCDLTRFTGGFTFDEPVHAAMWGEMRLRASAPGYVSQEQNLWSWDRVFTFTLVPTGF
jgi:hypothetical protein